MVLRPTRCSDSCCGSVNIVADSLENKGRCSPFVFEQSATTWNCCEVLDPYCCVFPSYLIYLWSGVPGKCISFAQGFPLRGVGPCSFHYFSWYFLYIRLHAVWGEVLGGAGCLLGCSVYEWTDIGVSVTSGMISTRLGRGRRACLGMGKVPIT